jgi:hypothetical protein
MNRTDSINDNNSSKFDSSKIDQAEQAVVRSVQRFEHAMESLARRVEESSHRVQHTIDLANRSKDDLFRIKDTLVSAVEPLQPYVHRVADTSADLTHRVQRNPMPFVIGVAAFFGIIAAGSYFWGRGEDADNRQLYGDLYGSRVDSQPVDQSSGVSREPSL